MNTNTNAKVVLCFGDSNTHGSRPDGEGRYAANKRWPGRLQMELGDSYYVIEEGLGGRTTNLDDLRPEKPMRNGLKYFVPCLASHRPVDMVLILLGTNDHKNIFNRSAEETAEVLGQYCQQIKIICPNAKAVLIAPGHTRISEPVVYYDLGSQQKSHELPALIKKVAAKNDALFYDATSIVKTGEDGLHWTPESHEGLAADLANIVRSAK